MATLPYSHSCNPVTSSVSSSERCVPTHNPLSTCAAGPSFPPTYSSSYSSFSSPIPKRYPQLSRCSTCGSSAPSRSPKGWETDTLLCQPLHSGTCTPQDCPGDASRGSSEERHPARHSSLAVLDRSQHGVVLKTKNVSSASREWPASPGPSPMPAFPSSPSLQLAAVNAAFGTHTPHTVLFLPPPFSCHAFDTRNRPCSSQRHFPSPSVGRLPEEDQEFPFGSSPLLLACVGRSVLISAIGKGVEKFCFSSHRSSSGSDKPSPVWHSPVSSPPPPRQYDVHTAPVTTLSFCHSLRLVCSTQRASSAHTSPFASLWCPYTVEERARLALSAAPRAEVVCCSFLPGEGGLLLLLRDAKHTLLGFMNVYEVLSSLSACKGRHLECPYTSTRTSPRTRVAGLEKLQTPEYPRQGASPCLSRGVSTPSMHLRENTVVLSGSIPLLAPSFLVECGRAPLHGLAVEPPLHFFSRSIWSSGPSSVSSASRFATFGNGHLRVWTFGLKPRSTEKTKSTERSRLGRFYLASSTAPVDSSFPSPSFRSCSFGPGFLSQHARTAVSAASSTAYPPHQWSFAARGFRPASSLGQLRSRGSSSFSSHTQGTPPTVTACAFLPDCRELIAGTSEGLIYLFRGLTAVRAVAAPSIKEFSPGGSRVSLILPLQKKLVLVATRKGTVSLLYTHGSPAVGSRLETEVGKRVGGQSERLSSSASRMNSRRQTLRGTAKADRRAEQNLGRPHPQRKVLLPERPGKQGTTRRACRPRRKSRPPSGLTHKFITDAQLTTNTALATPRGSTSICPKSSFASFRSPLTFSRRLSSRRWISPAPFAERLLDRPVHTPRSSYAAAYGKPSHSCRRTVSRSCPSLRRGRESARKANSGKAGEESGYLSNCDDAKAISDASGGITQLLSPRQRRDEYNSAKLLSMPGRGSCSTSPVSVLSRAECRQLQDASEPGDGSAFHATNFDPDTSRIRAGTAGHGVLTQGSLRAKRVIELRDVIRLHSASSASRADCFSIYVHENNGPEREPDGGFSRHLAIPSVSSEHCYSRGSPCEDSCHSRRTDCAENIKNGSLVPFFREACEDVWVPMQAAQIVGWATPSPAEMQRSCQPKYVVFVTESHVILLCVDHLCPEKSAILAQKPWGSVESAASPAPASAVPPPLYWNVVSAAWKSRKTGAGKCLRSPLSLPLSSASPSLLSPRPAGLSSGVRHPEEDRGRRVPRHSRKEGGNSDCEETFSRETNDYFAEIRRREDGAGVLGNIIATGGRCAVGGALQLWRVTLDGRFEAIGPSVFFEEAVTAVTFSGPLTHSHPASVLVDSLSHSNVCCCLSSPSCSCLLAVGCEDGSVCLFLVVVFVKHPPSGLSRDAHYSSFPQNLVAMQASSSSFCYSLLLISPPHKMAKSASDVTALAFNERATWLAASCSGVAGVQCLAIQQHSSFPVKRSRPHSLRVPFYSPETPEGETPGDTEDSSETFSGRSAPTFSGTGPYSEPRLSPGTMCKSKDYGNATRGNTAHIHISVVDLRREGFPANCQSLLIRGARTPLSSRGLSADTLWRSSFDGGTGCCGARKENHFEDAVPGLELPVFPFSLSLQLRVHPPCASAVRTLKFSLTVDTTMVNQEQIRSEEQVDDQEELLICQTADGALAAFGIPSGRHCPEEKAWASMLFTQFYPWASALPVKIAGFRLHCSPTTTSASPIVPSNKRGAVIVPGPLHQGVSGSSAFLVAFYDSSRHALGLVCLPPQLRCLPLARCSLQSLSSRPPSHSRSYQLGRAPRATNRGRPESPQSSRGRLGSRGLEQSPSAGRRSIPVPVTSVEETKDFRSEDFGAGAQTCVPAPLPVSPFLRGAGIADLRRPPRDYCQKIYHPLECFADSNKSLGPRHAVHTRDEAVIPGVNAPTRQGGCHVGIDMSSPPGGELVASPGTECDLLDVALRRALEAASLPGTCPAHEGPPTALLWISCYLASHSRSGRESNQLPSLRSSAREYLVSVSGREGCLYAWRLGKESDATKEQPTLPATMHDAQKREVSSSAVASYARDAPACLTERNWLSSRRKDQTDEDSGLGHLLSRHDWEPSFPAGDDARAKRTEMRYAGSHHAMIPIYLGFRPLLVLV